VVPCFSCVPSMPRTPEYFRYPLQFCVRQDIVLHLWLPATAGLQTRQNRWHDVPESSRLRGTLPVFCKRIDVKADAVGSAPDRDQSRVRTSSPGLLTSHNVYWLSLGRPHD